MDMTLSKLWEIVKDKEPWCISKSQLREQLNNNNKFSVVRLLLLFQKLFHHPKQILFTY